MPEEGEIVLCTVTKIFHHSVFVELDEYRKQGMIHISEVSPGRIRNLRDFVVEGKKVVCKILRIDQAKGHIDLSLRRVNEGQRKSKLEDIKQEQKAEKIIDKMASELKISSKQVYDEIFPKIKTKYEFLYTCFLDFVYGEVDLKDFNIDQKYLDKLIKLVKERIKLPKVNISGDFLFVSYEPNGVEIIKQAIKKALEKGNKDVIIKYKGAGKYSVSITASDYATAENIVYEVTTAAIDHMMKNNSIGTFERKDK